MKKEDKSRVSWHAPETDRVFEQLTTVPEGLAHEDAQRRMLEYGPNRLRPKKRRSAWTLFLNHFKELLIYVLLISAGVTAVIGHWVDAGIILGVVILNALIGFIQEGKAEKALEAIRDLLSSQATVMRGGERVIIPSEQLVPGDIVLIQSGDKVPGDLRLYKTKSLRIDEASLTGESVPEILFT
ncbi:MAG: HAD-IC family P-type ATPase [Deltaproteobacteria bacterium]|nr:HAD-IC family P-type ATPase [Deltaproteobacteria bacterium]